ncbi:hypothetical protein ABIA35_002153 [Catenulispora sp. MAP12-49]|uniref:hypothetical protein n=1 Tax=unclassified Catenulispora TaxID=414885 RepID=UPI0035152AF0
MLWFLMHGRPTRAQKRLAALAELHARASVRQAEEIVAIAWADQLVYAVQAHPGNQQPLEYQQLRLIRAARKRARAAERDRRKLLELGADPCDAAEMLSSVRDRRADGPSDVG